MANDLLTETSPERIASQSDERLEELYRELSTIPNIQSNLVQILRNRAELVRQEIISRQERRKQEQQEAELERRHREQIAASRRPTVATKVLDELLRRISYLKDIGFEEAPRRYAAFLDWLEGQPTTKEILTRLRKTADIEKICKSCGPRHPPAAATPEEIARVGLHFFEYCKEDGKNLPGLFLGFGLNSKWGGSQINGYFASAIDTYIQPFLNFLVHEIGKKDELLSADDVATFRMSMILSSDFGSRFPITSEALAKLSKEFFALDHSENWFNAANSCRELLKRFSRELYAVLKEDIPVGIKAGDVKALVKYVVAKRYPSGRTKDTLGQLINSVWDHTQCLLHNENATKSEAMRIYLWTALLISEIYGLETSDSGPG